MKLQCEVGIIGAGVAGLAAAGELGRAGRDVICLEAGNRIGGRILTHRDPMSSLPIELGAEFVHGRPAETFALADSARLTIFEHSSQAVYLIDGRPVHEGRVGDIADDVMESMRPSRRDMTFEEFLRHSRHPKSLKTWARMQVEGFNAARSDRISVRSLLRDGEAAEKIDGDRVFRIFQGYDSIPLALLNAIPEHRSRVRLNSTVHRIQWRRGDVTVHFRNAGGEESTLHCRRLIVTVSIGVLASDAIQFDPDPKRALSAAKSLEFGNVHRVTLRFREAFWEEKFPQAGFLLSQNRRFPTWWTTKPVHAPLLTAWMAGTASDDFGTAGAEEVLSEAMGSLREIFRKPIPLPEAFYFHDWRSDPLFRGAYSYVPAGALGARDALATPEAATLYFAGEAANTSGHDSTVHGAIASGRETARRILSIRRV